MEGMEIDFNVDNIVSRVNKLLELAGEKVKLAENGLTWEEVNNPLDEISEGVSKLFGVSGHLNSVMFNEGDSAEYEKTIQMVSKFYNDLGSNKKLYEAYKSLKCENLDKEQEYILNEGLKGFRLGGIELSPRGQKQLSIINERLSILSNEFSKNVIMATGEWKKDAGDFDLRGISAEGMEKFRTEEGLQFNLQIPAYVEVMTYAVNRQLREEVYKAYISRASNVGITSRKYDNTDIMNETLRLRAEKANILGFKNFSEMSIYSKMVKDTHTVNEFLSELVDLSREQAITEFGELERFAGFRLKPWDLIYYSERLKEEKYGFKKSELTPYFPEDEVYKGLFKQIRKLYNINIIEINEKTYHKDVMVLQLSDKEGVVGKIYFDPYSRENKRGGAWMDEYQGLNGNKKPVAYVVCNFNSPIGKNVAYFEFNELVTLFHEFGHALHHILTKVGYPCAAGINGVPWDGVELPSQYMENYCYEKDVLIGMSRHKESGDKLPNDLYNKLIESRNYQSAISMLRQCEFSIWDLHTHMESKDTYVVLEDVRKKTSLMKVEPENRFLNSFSHVFAGGYAAGYFSYKWAEVLSSDAYLYIKENGEGSSDAFRQCILETGGSKDFLSQYIKFRGREPSIDGLLKLSGIG